ncbi:hypothetical protein [Novilysobacter erysipheiresistens]|uniref:C1q domain-containing protein n=1 Tax=Novilysobacter erysipheiresistens TaxID=1749332 RepID=A0ABU7YUP7_9GAMM
MSKRKVPLWGNPRNFALVDTDATRGATIGENVYNADGSLFEPGTVATPAAGQASAVVIWRRVLEIPANVRALENTATTGLYAITAAGASATRTLTSTTLALGNANGVAGDPAINLADLTDSATGTFKLITRDQYGRLSGTADGTTSDVSEGANLYYTDVRADARITLQKGQPNGLATLGADSKLDAGQLPALAITDTFVVADEAAMLALVCEQGDVAVRSDLSTSFILTADPASVLANWQELLSPTAGAVTSFNGRTGSVTPASGDYTAAQVGADPAGTAAAIVTATITDGDTTHAPSGDAVFDALAGKADDAKLSVVAGLSANQTLANATTTKVALNTESVDTDGCFDTATGRFTPTKAGLYLAIATISFPRVNAADPITAGKRLISYIYKNGASYIAVTAGCNDSSTNVVQAVALAQMNGTTDYLEMYARRDTSIDYEIAAVGTQFSAIRIAA